MKIIFAPEVNDDLNSLVEILFEKEYFGFQDSAYNYVKELVDDILSNLSIRQHKPNHHRNFLKNMAKTCIMRRFQKTNALLGTLFSQSMKATPATPFF